MLAKEKCIQAINVWRDTRTNFSKNKELINTTDVINFKQDDCNWITKLNDNSNFHIYVDVHKNKHS